MTTYIKDEIIEKVKDNCDILNIISDYIPLKRSGANHVGLCPFHNEKTPSFTVSEQKQFFHCFGCGEGGDAVTFIMKKENLDFPDAIKFLADKLGMEIESTNKDNSKYKEERNKTFDINREAARYFHNNLLSNKKALGYLERRSISTKILRQFGLGFSNDSWDNLYNYLHEKGYADDEIEKTGLIGRKSGNNGYYDKFRNRIMFPIIDTKSRVIGFGGRVVDNSMPKYLNSQDTIVFNKGNNLYGLNLLSKFSNRKRILLVEGYMDVIALYSKGINYSVASLGTAFTERQGKLLKRYGEEIYICFDSDTAGTNATLKAIDILLKLEVSPKIIRLPVGMDPDDFINKRGLIEFEKLFMNTFNHVDFKIHLNKEKYNINDPEEKIKFTLEIAKIIKELKSPIEQDVYIDKVSGETGISKEAIEREIRGKVTPAKFTNQHKKVNIKPVETRLVSGQLKAEMDVIKLMITDKDYFDVIDSKMTIEDFGSFECREIYKILSLLYKNNEEIDEKVLFAKILEIPNLNTESANSIINNTIKFQPTNIDQVINDLINTIKYNNLDNKRKKLLSKIEELEKKEKSKEEESLLTKLCLDLIAINSEINLIN